MSRECLIEEKITKFCKDYKKTILFSLLLSLLFFGLWILGYFILIGSKKYHIYLNHNISLNNFLTLGAVLGTVLIGIGSNLFAKRQLEINQNTIKIELAIRYKDHYCKLRDAIAKFIDNLPNFYEDNELSNIKFNKDVKFWENYSEIYYLTTEAELLFSKDIVDINKHICNLALEICKKLDYITTRVPEFLKSGVAHENLQEQSKQKWEEHLKTRTELSKYVFNFEDDKSDLLMIYLKYTQILRQDISN